ncbi:MAG TPA: ScpA family protein [Candidatus Paceibacterota bacterium]
MSDNFTIKAPVFEGPLESLLDMIEARKLSISEVSMAEVCDAYLAHIEKLPELPLGETSQFILIASTLLLIKSRTLLPTMDLTEDERESVHELEQRLARLALIRKASRLLKREWGMKPLAFPKSAPDRPIVFSPREAARATILAGAHRILSTIPKVAGLKEASVAPVLALEDVIKQMHTRLTRAIRARFSELTKSAGRSEVIVYFLAMLELVRSGSASVTQERLFSDIEIEIENAGVPEYGV